jgi:arylsulfatase A-like enzyme
VYPEVTEVPLVFGFPFRLPKPVVVPERTANIDIWPTVLDLLGLPPLENVDGKSRMPEILAAARGEPGPPEDGTVIAHLDQTWGQRVDTRSPNVAIAERSFRYVQFRNPKGRTHEELFDRDRDPKERENRIEAEADVAKRLREKVDAYLESGPAWKDKPERLKLDEMQLNQLRALGYAVPGK